MAERYVRVKSDQGQISYGLLDLNQSVKLLSAAPWQEGQLNGEIWRPETYRLLPPCEPTKIIGIGRNYAAHAAELGSELPTEPLIFLKALNSLLPPEGLIRLPPQSQRVDYEGELAIIIGTACHNASPQQALKAIWGYTIANDVTARDLQQQDSQWSRAKGFDTFCPLGPWIVREISPTALLQTFRNGDRQPLQSATIDQMLFAPEFLVSYVSQIMTLMPGDVILTGTPKGVGAISEGDRLCVEIEGIGRLTNSAICAQPLPQKIVDLLEEED